MPPVRPGSAYTGTPAADSAPTSRDTVRTHTPTPGAVDGIKHFGLWRLEDAAASCFATRTWPADVPVPQGNIEFDVSDVATAAAELQRRGCVILTGPKTEPWGQEVARLLSPEGLLV